MDIPYYNPPVFKVLAGISGLLRLFQFTLAIALIRGFCVSKKQYLSSNYYFFLIILYLGDTPNIVIDSIFIIFDTYNLRATTMYYSLCFAHLQVILVAIMSIERVSAVMRVNVLKFRPVICIFLTLLAIGAAAILTILNVIYSNEMLYYAIDGILYIASVIVLLIGICKYWCCTSDVTFPEIKTEIRLFWSLVAYVGIQTIAVILRLLDLDV